MLQEKDLKKEIFSMVDSMKDILSNELWNNILLNCSKNEVWVLWMLYRQEEANMSQIAEYLRTPLNTATGIIARMEKKKLIVREHSKEDKRIVTIQLSALGREQINAIIKEISSYIVLLATTFTEEEKQLVLRMFEKVTELIKQDRTKEIQKKKVRKIEIE